MPLQDYNINTRDSVAGALYGLQQTRADIQTGIAEGKIKFGAAVKLGTGDKGVVAGGAAKVFAIALRQINREQEVRPGDGAVSFSAGETVPLLHEGRVNVVLQDAATVVRGAAVSVNAEGEFFSTGETPTTNVAFSVSGTFEAGSIVPVLITNAKLA